MPPTPPRRRMLKQQQLQKMVKKPHKKPVETPTKKPVKTPVKKQLQLRKYVKTPVKKPFKKPIETPAKKPVTTPVKKQQQLRKYVKTPLKKPVKKSFEIPVKEHVVRKRRGERWGLAWREGAAPILASMDDATLLALRQRTRKKLKRNNQVTEVGTERIKPRWSKKSVKPTDGTRSDAEAEALAQAKVEAGDFSLGSVLQVLRFVDVPESSSRTNVMPEGADSIRGMLLGLYVYGGSFGIATHTTKRPWLTRLLIGAVRDAAADFAFTSIQVNYNYASRPHVDKSNLGNSYIVALGDYSGGQLWVHDETGTELCALRGQEDVSGFYRVGSDFQGRQLQVHNTWTTFDGNKMHFTTPFDGERYSLIFFTNDRYADAPDEVRTGLRAAGFDFDWSAKQLEASKLAKCEGRRKAAEQKAADEAQLLLLRGRCMGRVWAEGWGLRCTAICAEGKDMCNTHIARDTWKTHGRMDGDVPLKKAEEMAKTQRLHVSKGRLPPVTVGATILAKLPAEWHEAALAD